MAFAFSSPLLSVHSRLMWNPLGAVQTGDMTPAVMSGYGDQCSLYFQGVCRAINIPEGPSDPDVEGLCLGPCCAAFAHISYK